MKQKSFTWQSRHINNLSQLWPLLIAGFFIVTVFGVANVASANVTAAPLLIDYTTEARDIITRDITLTNNGSKPARIYASVHEVSLDEDAGIKEFVSPSMTDRDTTITSWLQITRARLELQPYSSTTIPLTIRIHPETPPGTYHALIGFASGANRDNVEAKVMSGQAASVILKITIAENRREQLQLINFTTDRFSLTPDKGDISFSVENTGDFPLTPSGEVIIYDTTGKELAAVDVNSAQKTIAPGERLEITEPLPFIGQLGKNKAYLNLEYGNNKAAVFDTAFYYSIPWYYLLALILFIFIFFVFLLWIATRSYQGRSDFQEGHVDLPLFVRNSHEHEKYDHDLDLKNEKANT